MNNANFLDQGIETKQADKSQANQMLRKEYGQMIGLVRHFACQLANMFVVGYQKENWDLISVNKLPILTLGKGYNLVHSDTFQLYKADSRIVAIAINSVALQYSLSIMIGEFNINEYGEYDYKMQVLDGLGQQLAQEIGEPGAYEMIRNVIDTDWRA